MTLEEIKLKLMLLGVEKSGGFGYICNHKFMNIELRVIFAYEKTGELGIGLYLPKNDEYRRYLDHEEAFRALVWFMAKGWLPRGRI